MLSNLILNISRVPVTSLSTHVVMSLHAQAHCRLLSCTVILIVVIVMLVWSLSNTSIEMRRTKTLASMRRSVSVVKRLLGSTLACWLKRNYIQFVLNDHPTPLQRKQQMERFIMPFQHVTLSRSCVKRIQSVGKKLLLI